jgi:integrase
MTTAQRHSARLVLKFDQWSADDQAAWQTACRSGDPFDESGALADLRPATRRLIAASYGRWLGWLVTNELLQKCAAPAERVTPGMVERYVADLKQEVRDTTIEIRLHGLARAMQALAPDEDWTWLYRLLKHVRLNTSNKKDKQHRIRSSLQLYELGISLMAEAARRSVLTNNLATRYRDGLMIALLAARPLRIRNLAVLTIGVHLIDTSEGFILRFGAHEMKTHTDLEFPLPDNLVEPMRRYLTLYRPALLDGRKDEHLWITKDGNHMREGAIYTRITKLTKKAFGDSVNPHLFRDCAATSLAIEDPEHVHVASSLLNHATIETTTRHYNQATSLSAGRALNKNLRALRKRRTKDIKPQVGI